MKILITGTAGFIGNAVALRLLGDGHEILGLDSVNDYYDVSLKEARLLRLKSFDHFYEQRFDIKDSSRASEVFESFSPDRVIHLAAQAGVRYSLQNPRAYLESNLEGFLNILECCREANIDHLVFASSSSVYGANAQLPFSENDPVDHPVSFYAASKRSNELMAHSYSHLFRFPVTGLRFFTVYGPWGRPDMALFLFCRAILEGQPINVFNNGEMKRSFTYIDDIVEGIIRVLNKPSEVTPPLTPTPASSPVAPYRLFNIGNGTAVNLMTYINALEKHLGRQAEKNFLPLQAGDVVSSEASIADLNAAVDYEPTTSIDVGIKNFVDWYREYYQV